MGRDGDGWHARVPAPRRPTARVPADRAARRHPHVRRADGAHAADTDAAEQRTSFGRVVEIQTGGSSPPAKVIRAMSEMGFNVTHLYGLTEVHGPSTLCAPQEAWRSEEHTSELQSRGHLVCRLLLENKKNIARGPRLWKKPGLGSEWIYIVDDP